MVLNTRASLFVYFKARADIFELCGGITILSSRSQQRHNEMEWNVWYLEATFFQHG